MTDNFRMPAEADERRASCRRLVLAADADRRRLERELHDGPQQQLTALAVNLQLARRLVDADPAAAAALIDELRQDVQEAIDDARTLAHRIYPPLLDEGGLGMALRFAAADADIAAPVEVAPGLSCPPEVASTVYFCCVEVLERIGADATVTVREENGAVVFEVVTDASCSDERPNHESVRDRVEALGGLLTVEQESGGTRITGTLPPA
jgi:signal transduction histidine kinase